MQIYESDNFLVALFLIYFSYFITLNSTSSVMLNKNDDSEHACLIRDLKERAAVLFQ